MSQDSPQIVVTLRPVDLHNWQQVIHLQLSAEQARRVASNLYSLAEAYVQPRCTPYAIYANETLIGFVMAEYLPGYEAYNIPRFMIDVAWQGVGYGGLALQAVIDTLKHERPEAPILISLTPDNTAARRLYERHGFVDTGQRFHGEDVLRYP
ncbi:GNAT family N-acetyltransferase [Salinisphaera sp.]|uniref:GNAT family N-acetyltransferase n=1 Tax=Salinisphaera sp. TaxID=1914330 RepID=UPI000C52F886|nr:GNAT family N-acetyltransferase [Salinisphaera sp.]MBS64443.1 spermidine acetyltransferase [Salinisphaera sp.]